MDSKEYWEKREAEQLKHYITDEKEYDKQIELIYSNMLDACQTEINAFYGRYADKESITMAEAKKRVSGLDIKAYERKAKRYVKDKDFSKEANEEMRLYNLTMKVNRLEMLKANIGLELIAGHDELQKFMNGILQGRTEDELKRQAGILGETVKNNAQLAHAIVNASFHNATFSDRIWMYQDLLKSDLNKLLQSGLIQGKNARVLAKELQTRFGVRASDAERLMRTELARVQTEAQKQAFERNGFEMFTFIVNGGCCPICEAVSKKNGGHYKVKDMMPGRNAPPMHPHCRCSTAAYEDSDDYEAWLEYLNKGGTTEEYNKLSAAEKLKWLKLSKASEPMTRDEIKQKISDDKKRISDIDDEVYKLDREIDDYERKEDKFKEFDGLRKEEISSRMKVIEDRISELDAISERWYNRPERGTDEYSAWREWRKTVDPDFMDELMKLSSEKANLDSLLNRWDEYDEWTKWKKENPLDKLKASKDALTEEAKKLQSEIKDFENQLASMVIPSDWKQISGDHDSAADIAAANPNYSKGREYQVNCQRCVPTYEMRRRGYDVEAKPNLDWGNNDYLSYHSNEAFENAKVHWGLSGTGKRDIEKLMKEWGEGARAEVGVSWKGANSGHVFVAENVGGKVVYIDPQSGSMDVSWYFKQVKPQTTRVWRIDNLKPSDRIQDCCKARGEK